VLPRVLLLLWRMWGLDGQCRDEGGIRQVGGSLHGGARCGEGRYVEMRRREGVDDDDMALFKVVDEGVQICEIEAATGVITALAGREREQRGA